MPHLKVGDEVACADCRIEMEPPFELRGPFDDGVPSHHVYDLVRASDGWTYVLFIGFSEVYAYAPDGRFSRTMGRAGEGPGEFLLPRQLQVRGGILHVHDVRLRRRTELDRFTGETLGTVSMPDVRNMLHLQSGRTVQGAAVWNRESAGQPLHLYSEEGEWERSFGVEHPSLHAELEHLAWRSMAAAGPSTFWAAPVNEYRIQLWNDEGQLLGELTADREWFEPWFAAEGIRPHSPEEPPVARLGGVDRDPDGRLWVRLVRPAEEWHRVFEQPPTELDGMGAPIWDVNQVFDLVLEVVDPRDGRVVARRTFDRIHRSGGPGILWRSWLDEAGRPRLEITPMRLIR